MGAVSLCQPDRLAAPFTEEVKLGTPGLAASDRANIENIRAVQRENPFNALVINDASNGEHLVNAPAFAGYNGAVKYLGSYLAAFFYPAVYIDDIANFKMRDFLLKAAALYMFQKFCFHEYNSCIY
jgi:hypothetical protein